MHFISIYFATIPDGRIHHKWMPRTTKSWRIHDDLLFRISIVLYTQRIQNNASVWHRSLEGCQ